MLTRRFFIQMLSTALVASSVAKARPPGSAPKVSAGLDKLPDAAAERTTKLFMTSDLHIGCMAAALSIPEKYLTRMGHSHAGPVLPIDGAEAGVVMCGDFVDGRAARTA